MRLIAVAGGVSAIAFTLATLAVWGMEGPRAARAEASDAAKPPFRQALREVWAEPEARRFTIFIFVSMLAYSAQDLILEPFAGAVFNRSLGETTRISSLQHAGVLVGMIAIALIGSVRGGRWAGTLRFWTIAGCVAAAAMMLALSVAGQFGAAWPLKTSFFALGVANGVFAAAAIASMMQMVARGHESREGTRMGLWGAAQAVAFGLGGLAGAAAVDVARFALGHIEAAYAAVFILDAALFIAAAMLASRINRPKISKTDGFGPMIPAR
jgi:BCD family chlorophyll transporter-like MFS transporter